jgi:NTE family protein
MPSGWELLRNRLNPFSERVPAPSIGQILVGSTMLSSKQYLDRLLGEGRVDLFLKLPVQDFELLGFDEYQRLYEIGYETARKALASGELATR